MLKKENRLGDIRVASRNSLSTPIFILKIAKNQALISRFGFIVGKRVDNRATVRNRVKRQIRSFIENNLDNIEKGYDLLFIIKKEIVDLDTKSIWEITEKELKKQKILK